MERNKRRKYSDDVAPAIREQRDSPTIENLIQKLNQDLEDNYRMPDTDGKAASYLNTLSSGMDLSTMVSHDWRSTLVDVRLKNHPAKWIVEWGDDRSRK